MKINKKLMFIIIACIFLILSVFLMSQIYAKYLTSATGKASIPISRWNITVNNASIKNNSDFSSRISPVFPGNENIASGVIAPTAEGYFDLNFDFTNVDVSFQYNISVESDESSSISDIVITGYSIDDGAKLKVENNKADITNIIRIADNVKLRKLRVYTMWNDDPETSSMDNLADTASTLKSDSAAVLKVTVSFKQITS